MAKDRRQPYNAFETFVNGEHNLSGVSTRFLDGLERKVAEEGAPSAQHPQEEVVITAYFSKRMAYLMLFHSTIKAEKSRPPKVALPSTAHNPEPIVKVANRRLSEVAIKCEVELAYAGLPAEKEVRVNSSIKEVLLYKFSNPTLELRQKLTELINYLPTKLEG